MPLDSTNWSQTETKPDLSKPSLEGLSWLLRQPEKWPSGFSWDYSKPSRCAVGLGRRVWPKLYWTLAYWGFRRSFNMPVLTFARIFDNISDKAKTPLVVAFEIDAYLAETRK